MLGACPECMADIEMDERATMGKIISCPYCGVELEVVALTPEIVLELVPKEQGDWDE